jgi:hypothetical protein
MAHGVRIPRTLIRLRVSKAGFQPIEGSGSLGALPRYRLDPVDAAPPEMVRVVGGRDPVRFGPVGELDDFWIDRFEVTDRQFKAFVDQGGYGRRDYWREPFIDMAGNVKEWCWNETNDHRFLLGGAWDEPRYLFADYDAKARSSARPVTASGL